MPSRHQTNKDAINDILLPYDDFCDLAADGIQLCHGLLEAVFIGHKSMVTRSLYGNYELVGFLGTDSTLIRIID